MACDPQTFDQIAPQAFDLMKSEVQRQLGITIAADRGEASAKGFAVSWNYDRAAQRLTITCLEKPFIVPCGMINGQVAKLIDDVRSR